MFILYTIILILGLAASYTDIKSQKIKNKHLVLAILAGCAALSYMITTRQLDFNLHIIWNILIGLGIGLILYFADLWGAGDAKLFAVLCLLTPVGQYPKFVMFPSIAVFVNVFLISFLVIAITCVKEIFRNPQKIFKQFFSIPTLSLLGKSFLIIFSINQLVKSSVHFLIPKSTNFITAGFLFISYKIIKMQIRKIRNRFALVFIFSSGLLFNAVFYPEIFQTANLVIQLKRVSTYTLLFYVIHLIFDLDQSPDNKQPLSITKETSEARMIPFAPLMLVGTLLTNTHFLNWTTQLIRTLKR